MIDIGLPTAVPWLNTCQEPSWTTARCCVGPATPSAGKGNPASSIWFRLEFRTTSRTALLATKPLPHFRCHFRFHLYGFFLSRSFVDFFEAKLFQVQCSGGYDGGLPQTFLLEAKDSHTLVTVARIQSHLPHFNVSGLQPGCSYVLTVYSKNNKGQSKPVTLYAFTVKEAEKHTAGSTVRSNNRYLTNCSIKLSLAVHFCANISGFNNCFLNTYDF
jgi:hypothetical protein